MKTDKLDQSDKSDNLIERLAEYGIGMIKVD